MNKPASSAWPLLVFWAAAACADSVPLQEPSTSRDSAGVRIVENMTSSWAIPWQVDTQPLLNVGSVSGEPDQELDQVTGALGLPGDRIVVANGGRLELLFFGSDGRLQRRVGRRGQGPGEFQSLEWLSRHRADSVLALDVRGRRVSYFDSEGNLGRSVGLEPNAQVAFPRPVGVFADGSFLATPGTFRLGGDPPVRTERTEEPLFRYSADGKTVVLLGSFPGPEMAIAPTGPRGNLERRRRPFGRATAFAAAADRFYVADNATYEIRVYSISGSLQQLIRRYATPLAITDADVQAFEDSVLATGDAMSRQQMNVLFANLPPPPDSYPAYAADILVDPESNIWIRDYTRMGVRRAQWSVFESSGKFLGVVDMPSGLDVLEFGTDYVLGLQRDELDVEYVRKYRLWKGR